MTSSLSIKQWLQQASEQLAESGTDSAKLDAELLLCMVLNKNRGWLYGFNDQLLTEEQQQQLTLLLERRLIGEPMAYITGQREFWSLTLATQPSTLIPRPDTETLVEWALELPLPDNAAVLDLGAGTGAIALALASERSAWQVLGVDLQAEAVRLAQYNAQANYLPQVQFKCSNWFSAIDTNFDLIVSNPPYIDAQDPHLNQGDVRFEPHSALVADKQGLADIEHIIQQAKLFLRSQGWLLLEHGYQQAEAVQQILQRHGFENIETRMDLAGQPRITGACFLQA